MVQVNNEKLFARVRFKKIGNLQYISHLDLVRTMHKVIVRAKLPLWYTEGFNPKPKMVFAAPLSIGTESVCEFMDIRLTERMDPDEIMRCLNENLTGEMNVTEVYYPETKFTDLKWLSYTIRIKTQGADNELKERCNSILSGDKLEVLKNTKSGEALVDIRSLVKCADTVLDGEWLQISCILSADPSCFLNPEYIVKILKEQCGVLSCEQLTSECYSIMRECAYDENMNEFR